MKPVDADDGPPRDPWLSQALRHAPDADVVPPPALSAAILREARAAAAVPTAMDTLGQRLRAVWAWLATPPVAAGFASLMVATVVGLMWWDQPLDVARPELDRPRTATHLDAAAPAVAPPAVEAAAAPEPGRAEGMPRTRRADAPRSLAKATPAKPAMPAPAPTLPSPEPTAQAAARGAVAQDSAAAAPAQASAENRQAQSETSAPATAVPAAAPPVPRAAAALRAREPQALGLASGRDTPPLPLGPLRAAIAADPARWAWQRGDAAARPANAATLRWLDQLAQAARPSAQVVSGADTLADAGGSTAAPATALLLLQDGSVAVRLWLRSDSVEVYTAGIAGSFGRASLTPAAAAALESALAAAFD